MEEEQQQERELALELETVLGFEPVELPCVRPWHQNLFPWVDREEPGQPIKLQERTGNAQVELVLQVQALKQQPAWKLRHSWPWLQSSCPWDDHQQQQLLLQPIALVAALAVALLFL